MSLNPYQFEQLMREQMAQTDRQSRLAWMKTSSSSPRPTGLGLVRSAISSARRLARELLSRPRHAIGLTSVRQECRADDETWRCDRKNVMTIAMRNTTVDKRWEVDPCRAS